MTTAARAARRARWLVSGALVAVIATAVLVGLLVAERARGAGPAPVLFHGLAAVGTAGLAVGLLVLARAAALARGRAAWRARGMYNRCLVGAAVGAVAALLAGVLTASAVGSSLPAWGGGIAAFLLLLLVPLALRLRVVTATRSARRPGGEGESEQDGAPGAR